MATARTRLAAGEVVNPSPSVGGRRGPRAAAPAGRRLRAARRTAVLGHLAGIDDEGRLLFAAEAAPGPPSPVVIGCDVPDATLVRAARGRRRALVLHADDGGLLLVGLVRERVADPARDARPGELELRVDGERLSLGAEREIELRCGRASLLLRRDGRVVLSGTYVVTSSRGPMKIKGATIALN